MMTKMEDLIENRTAQERLIIAKTLIESVLDDLQPEPTLEQIKEYCRKRCLSIVDNALLEKYASAQSDIIRCRDCIKREICRTSTTWAVAPKDDWYCADAERRTT